MRCNQKLVKEPEVRRRSLLTNTTKDHSSHMNKNLSNVTYTDQLSPALTRSTYSPVLRISTGPPLVLNGTLSSWRPAMSVIKVDDMAREDFGAPGQDFSGFPQSLTRTTVQYG
jgi:hypothetical protein